MKIKSVQGCRKVGAFIAINFFASDKEEGIGNNFVNLFTGDEYKGTSNNFGGVKCNMFQSFNDISTATTMATGFNSMLNTPCYHVIDSPLVKRLPLL